MEQDTHIAKLEAATAFLSLLDEALYAHPGNIELRYISDAVGGYVAEMHRVWTNKKLNELEYYRLCGLQALAAAILQQMLEQDSDLANWNPGDTSNPSFQIATMLTYALEQFSDSLENGARTKNFTPLSPEALARILA